MDIPNHLLPQVTCSLCNAFLYRSPVFVSLDNRNICHVCASTFTEDQNISRNSAYEGLAQMMRFPCKYRSRGCPEIPVWNSSHENDCVYGEEKERKDIKEVCSICQVNISILPRYECIRGHKICLTCTNPINFRCQLCKSKINNEIIYLCKYWSFGCKYKSDKDQISRHEIDCDVKGYKCPFNTLDCKWSGPLFKLSSHLKTSHFEDTFFTDNTTRLFNGRDDSWVMVCHEEVFQCYCWIGESNIEWIAKYIGPQDKSDMFSCEMILLKTPNVLKLNSKCHGWNNLALEKCMQVHFDDMKTYLTDRQCTYKFRILKN